MMVKQVGSPKKINASTIFGCCKGDFPDTQIFGFIFNFTEKAKETSAFGAFQDCMATQGIPLWNQTLGNLISRKQLRNRGSRSHANTNLGPLRPLRPLRPLGMVLCHVGDLDGAVCFGQGFGLQIERDCCRASEFGERSLFQSRPCGTSFRVTEMFGENEESTLTLPLLAR